jgi:phosphomevalonate kinase
VTFAARAPGKLVVLGEYAVLGGSPALVMAVDRHHTFEAAHSSDVALVDLVRDRTPRGCRPPPWEAELDSAEQFHGATKLGLGSSAAALCAWAGAWSAYLADHGCDVPPPRLTSLIEMHRSFQRGAGSGLDVAAAFHGGLITFRLDEKSGHHVGVVRLPNSVGFAGIFAGRSASTPGLLARYRAWRANKPAVAASVQADLRGIAEAGCAAARSGDGDGLVQAAAAYGRRLGELGRSMGADIVTAEHRAIGQEAERFGVTYKVSGAGGGDLGLALSTDPQALRAFAASVRGMNFAVLDLQLDRGGLSVEERAE